MDLSTDLDIDLAWRRHKNDLNNACFSDHPYEVTIIDDNFLDWVSDLKVKLQNYNPSPCEIINIPKPYYHLRPGSVLTAEDATIYQGLLHFDSAKIRESMLWSASIQDTDWGQA